MKQTDKATTATAKKIWQYLIEHETLYGTPIQIAQSELFTKGDNHENAKKIGCALDSLIYKGAIYCCIYFDRSTRRKVYLWRIDKNYQQQTLF